MTLDRTTTHKFPPQAAISLVEHLPPISATLTFIQRAREEVFELRQNEPAELALEALVRLVLRRGVQGWKFMSCSQTQELGQLTNLASDLLFTLVQPIRVCLLVDKILDNDYNS